MKIDMGKFITEKALRDVWSGVKEAVGDDVAGPVWAKIV
jgi:hypothetical protein